MQYTPYTDAETLDSVDNQTLLFLSSMDRVKRVDRQTNTDCILLKMVHKDLVQVLMVLIDCMLECSFQKDLFGKMHFMYKDLTNSKMSIYLS